MPISPSALFLSPDLSEEDARAYLGSLGFRDPAAADEHLQTLADEPALREALGALAEDLLDAVVRTPDPDAALVAFARYTAARSSRTAFVRYLSEDPRALGVLVNVMGTSPFLGETLIRNPEYFHWLVSEVDRHPPDEADLAEDANQILGRIDDAPGRIDALKRFKRRQILRVASRDILGRETLQSATQQISSIADLVVGQALRIAEAGLLAAAGEDRLPGRFAVIGMGKLGGRELNYSSDIDLVYVYEPDDESEEVAHRVFHRLARALTTTLTEYTDESYLYRLDLRLRPMGRRGNIAYSLEQHRHYYESWGETFERFALIKARPIAGDPALGARFIELLQPFVYRKYLDHTAIEEMFRYRGRIERGQPNERRDIKSGPGGIREIELFAQVLQLTYGAGNADLRQQGTLPALAALERAGLVTPEIGADLARAYEFLRTVEHRLQIVHDQQTHALARARSELEISARRLGMASAEALEARVEAERARVHGIYRTIFDRRAGTSDFRSRQFFRVLVEDATEEEAVALLAETGMPDAGAALDLIRSLDEAVALAPSRSTAQNVLANLIPVLLDRVRSCAAPQRVLMRFEQVTGQTGAPVSFFRTLLEDRAFLDVLIATLDLGDLTANRLIRHPELLDSLLAATPDLEQLQTGYRKQLSQLDPDDRLDQMRRFKSVEEFKAVAAWVGDGSIGVLQQRLSALAEALLTEVAARHAAVAQGEPDWAIFALGKLGGRELTVHSDLDLVVVYRGEAGDSDTFLQRQNFVAAMVQELEEPTGEGVLYHVDTRLRPEGKKGALAMPFDKLAGYLEERAEIWERLAWTRGRFVAGSRRLAADVEAATGAFVYGPWNAGIPQYTRDLRARMERELTAPGLLEFKVGRGGLVDIDFALQLVQIREGRTRPEFRIAGTRQLLESLPPTPLLTAGEISTLRDAHGFLRRLETLARLRSDTHVSALPATADRLEPLGRQMGFRERSGDSLLDAYQRIADEVRHVFDAVVARLGE